MTLGTIGKSTYSKLVTTLINRICDTTAVADSMYEQAVQYFQQAVAQQAEKIELDDVKKVFPDFEPFDGFDIVQFRKLVAQNRSVSEPMLN